MHTKNAKEIPVPVPDTRTGMNMFRGRNQAGYYLYLRKPSNTKLSYIPELAEIQNDRCSFSLTNKTKKMRYFLILFSSYYFLSCSSQNRLTTSNSDDGYITTETGLKYKILKNGNGQKAKVGQEVLIRETTSYLNGTVLYSNENSGNPVKVLIGGNQATNAVDEGLRGMQEGEIRYLIATPGLVKRRSYPPNVSPDSTLTIKIILHKIL